MVKPKAGWYPDPYDSAMLRYWTGRYWTSVSVSVKGPRPNLDARLIDKIESYRASRTGGRLINAPAPTVENQSTPADPVERMSMAERAAFFAKANPLSTLMFLGLMILVIMPKFALFALALIAVGAGFAFFKTVDFPQSDKKEMRVSEKKVAVTRASIYERITGDLKAQLEEYCGIVEDHRLIAKHDLIDILDQIFTNVQELFRRLDKYASEQQKQVAQVQYVDVFNKLNQALGDEYYLDIYHNPELWEEPKERLQAVNVAVSKVSQELILNIQKVNASKDLEFKVALDGLMRSHSGSGPSELMPPPITESFWTHERFNKREKDEA